MVWHGKNVTHKVTTIGQADSFHLNKDRDRHSRFFSIHLQTLVGSDEGGGGGGGRGGPAVEPLEGGGGVLPLGSSPGSPAPMKALK